MIENIIEKRKGMYVHALEVDTIYDLTYSIKTLTDEFIKEGYSYNEILDFFNTISLYYLGGDDIEENEIYDFNIEEFLSDLF